MSFPLHQVLSQLLTVLIFNVNILFCLAKPPPPIENVPPLCVPLRPSAWRSCSLTLTTDSLYLTTEGKETTQPGSDNILFCRICCLFVHFNNSYKIKKVKGLDFLSGYIVQRLKEKFALQNYLKKCNFETSRSHN